MSSESDFTDRFTLDEESGELYLRRLLIGDELEEYTVSSFKLVNKMS